VSNKRWGDLTEALEKHLIVGRVPRELWASENRGLRTAISMVFLGKFGVEGILGKVSTFK